MRNYILVAAIIAGLYMIRKPIMRKFQTTLPAAKPYLDLFGGTERRYGLPESLLLRMGWIESRYNKDAKHPLSGAQGIMQIVPRWHPGVDPLDPNQAIPYAGKYMAELYNRYRDWPKAIAAYNWGLGNLDKLIQAYGPTWRERLPKETRDYIAAVESVIDLPGA